jgi:endonuclease/exonuclease/phosphatase family metal-dependent hydrolase
MRYCSLKPTLLLFSFFLLSLPLIAQDDDNTLRVVTWNLEWFGSTGSGPSNESIQRINAARVIDELKPDLIALQEVRDRASLQSLADRLSQIYSLDYDVYVPTHLTGPQKMVYLLKSDAFQVFQEGAWDADEGLSSFDWANRFPYVMLVNYTNQMGTATRIRLINIHAKAFSDSESYNRRKDAADDLHTYISNNRNTERIIFLGDYNDDVDVSIFNNEQTPYRRFVQDPADFNILSGKLSAENRRSTVSFREMIDHITITNELEEELTGTDVFVHNPESYIGSGFGDTTSDHYPVVADLKMGTDTSVESLSELPNAFSIKAYPNPFNPTTTVQFSLREPASIRYQVVNMLGQVVQESSMFTNYEGGSHQFPLNLSNQPSGVYRVVLISNTQWISSIPISLLK